MKNGEIEKSVLMDPQNEVRVEFPENVEDEKIRFAVIAARYDGRWILCRHRARSTWEIPGGHREEGETPEQAARRELWEETGAVRYILYSVSPYSVSACGETSYGMLYFAEVEAGDALPKLEIAETALHDALPAQLTYPMIQPALYERAESFLRKRNAGFSGKHPAV